MLILKINFKNKIKNIILIYFQAKNILKLKSTAVTNTLLVISHGKSTLPVYFTIFVLFKKLI